jgi:hypothetical protein
LEQQAGYYHRLRVGQKTERVSFTLIFTPGPTGLTQSWWGQRIVETLTVDTSPLSLILVTELVNVTQTFTYALHVSKARRCVYNLTQVLKEWAALDTLRKLMGEASNECSGVKIRVLTADISA